MTSTRMVTSRSTGEDEDAAPGRDGGREGGAALAEGAGCGSGPKCTPGPLAAGGSSITQPGSMSPGFSSRPPFGCSRPLLSLKICMNRLLLPSVCTAISERLAGPLPRAGTTKYLTGAGVGDRSATAALATEPVHMIANTARAATTRAPRSPAFRDRPPRSRVGCDLCALDSVMSPIALHGPVWPSQGVVSIGLTAICGSRYNPSIGYISITPNSAEKRWFGPGQRGRVSAGGFPGTGSDAAAGAVQQPEGIGGTGHPMLVPRGPCRRDQLTQLTGCHIIATTQLPHDGGSHGVP